MLLYENYFFKNSLIVQCEYKQLIAYYISIELEQKMEKKEQMKPKMSRRKEISKLKQN